MLGPRDTEVRSLPKEDVVFSLAAGDFDKTFHADLAVGGSGGGTGSRHDPRLIYRPGLPLKPVVDAE